jgi:hypothetical protein
MTREATDKCPRSGNHLIIHWIDGEEIVECDVCDYPWSGCASEEELDDYDDYPDGWPADEPDYNLEKEKA